MCADKITKFLNLRGKKVKFFGPHYRFKTSGLSTSQTALNAPITKVQFQAARKKKTNHQKFQLQLLNMQNIKGNSSAPKKDKKSRLNLSRKKLSPQEGKYSDWVGAAKVSFGIFLKGPGFVPVIFCSLSSGSVCTGSCFSNPVWFPSHPALVVSIDLDSSCFYMAVLLLFHVFFSIFPIFYQILHSCFDWICASCCVRHSHCFLQCFVFMILFSFCAVGFHVSAQG